MTEENKKLLERINAYAENVLGEIDPQKKDKIGRAHV